LKAAGHVIFGRSLSTGKRFLSAFLLITAFFIISIDSPAFSYVTVGPTGQYLTIEAGLIAATLEADKTCSLEAGVFTGPDNGYNIDWPNVSGVTLRGAGSTETIISAEALGRCISIEGAVSLTIEGLTIRDGKAPTPGLGENGNHGAGVYHPSSSGTTILKNCILSNNIASNGVAYLTATPSGGNGGGIYTGGNLTITNCSFTGNKAGNGAGPGGAGGNGGSAYVGGIASVTGTAISNSIAGNGSGGGGGGRGGGIYLVGAATFETCVFSGNTSGTGTGSGSGGAIYASASADFKQCKFHLNKTAAGSGSGSGSGGGAYITGTTTVINCIFVSNEAGSGGSNGGNGGGLYAGTATLYNDTFIKNAAGTGSTTQGRGGGAYFNSGTNSVANTIFWINTAPGLGAQIFNNSGTNIIVKYSDILSGEAGIGGNLTYTKSASSEPLFLSIVDGQAGFLKLDRRSPCIDNGTNEAGVPSVDYDNNARPYNKAYDMGAFESQDVLFAPIYVSKTGSDLSGTGSAEAPYASVKKALSRISAGGLISAASGTYYEHGLYWPNRDHIKLIGAGANMTTISGEALGRIISFESTISLTIEALTMKRGKIIDGHGGAMFFPVGGTLKLKNVNFISNEAISSTGAIVTKGGAICADGYPGLFLNMENCRFDENFASNIGGAISSLPDCDLTAKNCIFRNNSAPIGGGVLGNAGIASMTNCTFYGNSGGGFGSIANWNPCYFTNCIIWGNELPFYKSDIYNGTIKYSDVQQANWGSLQLVSSDCISVDPLFVNALAGDFHVLFTSECNNSGTFEGAPAFDLDGISRPLPTFDANANFDMGCYEQIGLYLMNLVYVSTSGNDLTGTGTSPATAFRTIKKGLKYAKAGALVSVEAGTYLEHDIKWPNRNNIRLLGAGSDLTIISGEGLGRIISVEAVVSLSLESITIKHGKLTGDEDNGAGILLPAGASLSLKKAKFINNRAEGGNAKGGAIYINGGGQINAEGCIFSRNYAINTGGVICVYSTSSCNGTITSCIFNDNDSFFGGVLQGGFGYWNISNCTFSNNTGVYGDVFRYGSITLTNSIIWGGDDAFDSLNGDSHINYCDIQYENWAGFGFGVTSKEIKSVDPLFINASAYDFHLLATSECVNSGTFEGAALFDLDGNSIPNPRDPSKPYLYYDMGCYDQPGSFPSYYFVYVATTGSNTTGAGTYGNPYQTINFALTKVATNGVITLAPGVYRERNLAWTNRKGVTLRGAGTNETIISAEALGRAINVGSAVSLTIEALTIRDGKVNGTGGAVNLAANASLIIRNVVIRNCSIEGTNNGGAIYSYSASVTAEYCEFSQNYAGNGGGVCSDGIWKATNCTFINNYAVLGGGVSSNADWTAINCKFINNKCNTTNGLGGVASSGYWTTINCLFSGSRAYGGGIAISPYAWNAVNCVFYNNSSVNYGSINNGGAWNVVNSIFWQNYTDQGKPQFNNTTATVSYSANSDIAGTGNFNADPLFISITESSPDYLKLKSRSPCIDNGTKETAGITVPTYDMVNNSRPYGVDHDMGAYEMRDIYFTPVSVATTGSNATGTGSTEAPYATIKKALTRVATNGAVSLVSGIYREHDLLWPKRDSISLIGAGANLTIISAEALGRIISLESAISLTIEALTMKDGYLADNGGAILMPLGGTLSLKHANFLYNKLKTGGPENTRGGVVYSDADLTFTADSCIFDNNVSNNGGGVVSILSSNTCSGRATNCIFSNNSSWIGGAIQTSLSSTWNINNCTFYNNSGNTGGTIYGGVLTLTNSIFWSSSDAFYYIPGSTIKYCDIQSEDWTDSGITSKEIKSVDPLFVNASAGNFHLLPTSECVDTGTFEGAAVIDLDGIPRPQPQGNINAFDMGAYEQAEGVPTVIVIQPNGGEVLSEGITYEVKWELIGSPINDVYVRLSTNDGQTWQLITQEPGVAGVSTHEWVVNSIDSNKCLISVEAQGSSGWNYDKSDAPFSIYRLLNVVYVSTTGSDQTGTGTSPATAFKTIKKALEYVAAGGTVSLEAGIYKGTGNRDIIWPKRNNIRLLGAGADLTIISGEALGRIISLESSVSLTIEALTMKDGYVVGNGGAILLPLGGTLSLKRVNFLNNQLPTGGPDTRGGAVYSGGILNLAADGCIFDGNKANNVGGAVAVANLITCTCRATNCIFKNNSAGFGGAIGYSLGRWDITNCTFYNNSGSWGDTVRGADLYMTNSIIWNNSNAFDGLWSTSVIKYCDIQGEDWTNGVTSIEIKSVNPLFVNASAGNFRMLATSECIDSATFEGAPVTDLDGNARPLPPATLFYDMGCYEQYGLLQIAYVSPSGNDTTGTGTSPATAFKTIGIGLQNVKAGGLVSVDAGVYSGTNNGHDIVWPVRNNITLRGAGSLETIISAEALGRAITVASAETLAIEGLTIQKGVIAAHGGGIYLTSGSNLSLKNVAIKNCSAEASNNYGGAIYANGAAVSAKNCIFERNKGFYGGVGCQGIWNVVDCCFDNNTSTYGGVAMFGTWTVTRCAFRNNIVVSNYGGVVAQSDWTVNNSIFSGNNAPSGGVSYLGTMKAINCDFYGNTGNSEGSVGFYGTWPIVRNCIFWGNYAPANPVFSNVSGITATYSDIQPFAAGWPSGTGNISIEPLFVSTNESDTLTFLRLKGGSPCIDTASSEAPSPDLTGINVRPHGLGNDMGAYEYQGPSIRVNSPNGGESVPSSGTWEVTWTATDDGGSVTNIAIRYSKGPSDPWIAIDLSEVNDGSYIWSVPTLESATCRISIEATDNNGNTHYDVSNNYFEIKLPALPEIWVSTTGSNTNGAGTVNSPLQTIAHSLTHVATGGAIYAYGGTYYENNINWTGNNNVTLKASSETSPCTIDAMASGRAFIVPAAISMTIESFTICKTYISNLNGSVINLISGSSLSLKNVTIRNCTLEGVGTVGGAIYANGSSVDAQNCIFIENKGNYGSVGCYGTWNVANCSFGNNQAPYGGVAAYGTWTIAKSTFSGNYGSSQGGVFCWTDITLLSDCTVKNNIGNLGGFAIMGSITKADNCIFFKNNSIGGGGGISNMTSWTEVTNCTFYGNTNGGGSGSVGAAGTWPNIKNCIFWGNKSPIFSGATTTITYSDNQDSGSGTGNISTDPLFVSTNEADLLTFLRLKGGSPCIDTASSEAPSPDLTGINARPHGRGNDMGAYEYQGPSIRVVYPNGGEVVTVDATANISWEVNDDPNNDMPALPLKINYSTNSGSTWNLITAETSATPPYSWTVPSVRSKTCLISIEVKDNSLNVNYDKSNAVFEINDPYKPVVTVEAPNGAEVIRGGSVFNVVWRATDNVTLNQNLIIKVYLASNEVYQLVATTIEGISGTGTYEWTTPSTWSSTECKIRVSASDESGNIGSDESNIKFTIDSKPPTIYVSRPTTGEALRGGSPYLITWEVSDNVGVKPNSTTLEVSLNNGATWLPIVSNLNASPYIWTVNKVDTTEAKIRALISDTVGNIGTGTSGKFIIDSTSPEVIATSPLNAAKNVSPTANIIITFSETMETSTVVVTMEPKVGWAKSWNASNTVVTFDPVSSLIEGQLYKVTVEAGAKDMVGNMKVAAYPFTFEVADITPPVITVLRPATGEALRGASQYLITWEVSDNVGIKLNATTLEVSLDNGATWTPITKEVNASPYIWTVTTANTTEARIRATVQDTSGNIGTGMSGKFIIDSTPPSVITTSPPNAAKNVSPIADIMITFSETMETTTVVVTMEPKVGWAKSWNASNTIVTFDPVSSLIEGQLYRVTVEAGAKDKVGNIMASPYSFTFEVSDYTSPIVTVEAPNGTEFIKGGSVFGVIWRAWDNKTANQKLVINIYLTSGEAWQYIVTTTEDITGIGLYQWTVPSTWSSTECKIKVTASDESGNIGSDESNARFTIDSNPPVINVSRPATGEALRGTSQYLITWEASDNTGIKPNSTTLEVSLNNGATWLNIVSGYNTSPYPWTVTTADTAEARIRATVQDVLGNVGTAMSGKFTIDSTPPAVLSTSPLNASKTALSSANIIITFSETIETSTVVVTMEPKVGWVKSWNASNTVVTFDPVSSLIEGQLYRVTVEAGAKDMVGNIMASSYAFTFEVSDISAPTVTVLRPATGEAIRGGSQYLITWEATDNVGIKPNSTTLEVSFNNGSTWTPIMSGLNTSPYGWTVNAVNTTEARIRVILLDTTGNIGIATSGAFTVDSTSPSVLTTTPVNGIKTAPSDTNIVITFSETMETSTIVVTMEPKVGWARSWDPSSTIVTFDPTSSLIEGQSYRVTVEAGAKDMAGNIMASAYSFTFEVVDTSPPVVTVLRPADSEGIKGGIQYLITWEVTDNVGVKPNSTTIEVSLNDGSAWTNLVSGFNASPYPWTVNITDTTEAKIKVTAVDNTGNLGTGLSGRFIIDSSMPQVTLGQPNGGEILIGGAICFITWEAKDAAGIKSDGITLRYSVNSGFTWTFITKEANTGSYAWGIPMVTSASCRVSVEAEDFVGNIVSDKSNADFTILGGTITPSIEIYVNQHDKRFINEDIVPPNRTNTIYVHVNDMLKVPVAEMLLDGSPVILSPYQQMPGLSVFFGYFSIVPHPQLQTHTMTFYVSDEAGYTNIVTYETKVLAGGIQVVGVPLNYPNPFKPLSGGVTRIQYALSNYANVTILMYDVTGQEVKRWEFASGQPGGRAGINSIEWDGKTLFGEFAANGMYIYKIIVDGRTIGTGKLVVLD